MISISRRSFIQLVSWGSVSALIWPTTTTAESAPAPENPVSVPSATGTSFDYRVTTVSGIVRYASWSIKESYDGIVLLWRTSAEFNNRGFSIEHQGPEQDDADWTTFDSVESEGAWTESTDYRYVVSDPTPGEHRFRLREQHEDGDVDRTSVVSIRAGGISTWKAERSNEGIVLRWRTPAEYKNKGFVLQRTRENQDEWETLDFIDGQGTTSSPSSYSYVASNLSPGPHQFRLRKVRNNGDAEYTDVVSSLATGISTWETEKNEEGMLLQWTTAAEYRNDEFEVQHMDTNLDQEEWESLGSVDGEGTTSSPTSYQYLVSNLSPGEHRFRLKQIAKNGEVQYTDPISARARGISTWTATKDDDAGRIVLEWTTATEYRNDGFSVQHTGPEQDEWESLTFVDGEDTTSSSTEYRYVASDLRPGPHRFRIKQVSMDGDAEHTSAVSKQIGGIMKWTASKTNKGIELQWRTALPENDDAYVVEHQAPEEPRQDWTPIKRIESDDRKDQTKDHSYTAADLVPGTHRFRLRHVKKDGTAEHTEPVSIRREMDSDVRFTPPAPNPIRTRATLSFAVREKQSVTITLYDVLGQEVKTLYRGTPSPGENQLVPFDVSRLASGTYFVRLMADEYVDTHRCTVVR